MSNTLSGICWWNHPPHPSHSAIMSSGCSGRQHTQYMAILVVDLKFRSVVDRSPIAGKAENLQFSRHLHRWCLSWSESAYRVTQGALADSTVNALATLRTPQSDECSFGVHHFDRELRRGAECQACNGVNRRRWQTWKHCVVYVYHIFVAS